MKLLINLPIENDLLSLFTKIWIETHFLLAQPVTYFKSLLTSAVELSILCPTENKEVSLAINLTLDDNSSARSFLFVKKGNGPSIEPCKTPALTLVHFKSCPFKTNLSLKAHQICHFVLI